MRKWGDPETYARLGWQPLGAALWAPPLAHPRARAAPSSRSTLPAGRAGEAVRGAGELPRVGVRRGGAAAAARAQQPAMRPALGPARASHAAAPAAPPHPTLHPNPPK